MSRVAVVTGGASGVGRAIAEHLARAGHSIAVLDIHGRAASLVADDLEELGLLEFCREALGRLANRGQAGIHKS